MSGINAYNQDTVPGRVFFSMDSLGRLSLESWLGLNLQEPYRYFDSGIAYFITSQSVIAVLVFLLTYSFLFNMQSDEGRAFKNMAIFSFALSLLVSNSYFSIKTSALWWFTCGCLWHWSFQRPDVRGTVGSAPLIAPERVS